MTGGRGPYLSCGRLLVQPTARALLPRLDTLIFDVDGVLLDARASFWQAAAEATRSYLHLILGWPKSALYFSADQVARFKVLAGFNDEVEIAFIAVLWNVVRSRLAGTNDPRKLRRRSPGLGKLLAHLADGGGPRAAEAWLLSQLGKAERAEALASCDPEALTQLFRESYVGRRLCEKFYRVQPRYLNRKQGLLERERPLIDPNLLPPGICKFGIYSGRFPEEIKDALERTGLRKRLLGSRLVIAQEGMAKPDPAGLVKIVRNLDSRAALLVGDSPDDHEAALRYRKRPGRPPLLSAIVLTGALGRTEAKALRPDLIAPEVNSLLRWLGAVQGGDRLERHCPQARRKELP